MKLIPLHVHMELKPKGAEHLDLLEGTPDLYSLWRHAYPKISGFATHHYYYLCDRMVILAVLGDEELAMVAWRYLRDEWPDSPRRHLGPAQ